ncbi:hypothetical protein ColTof4_04004 [Colletotrichum tofieldiae]|nr:hypothetical protein ColTof3_13851 [Colletotrichum tofieldiae]GKT71581.1 hypothetical protein ColTof4_04004 [Colletotrichum tofieldiae]
MAKYHFDCLSSWILKYMDLPGLGQPGNNGLPAESNFALGTPTTTITDAPLPSNSAYPWGGLGPVFRHNDESEPKTGGSLLMKPEGQKENGAWWSR